MNLPAHSSLKCEHGTYEPTRSYPHTRVQQIRTFPPASITHLKSPLRTSPLVTNPAYPWPSHQTHPCKSICNGSCPCIIAWRCLSAAKQNCAPSLMAVILYHKASCANNPSICDLSPGGSIPAARRHTSKNEFYWFRHCKIDPNTLSNHFYTLRIPRIFTI